MREPRAGTRAALGAAIGTGGILVALAFAAMAGAVRPAAGGLQPGLLLLGTVTVLAQAGVEELYFRGWLLRALDATWGPVAALLLSALAFAGLHLLGGARAPLSLLNLLLGGLLFGLLAQRSGGLAAPVAAHGAWNWVEELLLGLDPNPGIGSYGAVVNLDLVGSPWWGASAEGLNASLAASFALLALLPPLAAWSGATRRLTRPARSG